MSKSENQFKIIQIRVKEARRALDLTQTQLAERVYVTRKMISDIENGNRTPNAIVLYNLAMALHVSVDWLMGISDNKKEVEITSIMYAIYQIMQKYSRDKQQMILSGMKVLTGA